MRKTLPILLILTALFSNAQKMKLSALRIHSALKIDGILDETIWQQASFADSFIVNSPHFGELSSQKTKVHILYDDQAVYVGAYLYDEPTKIRKQLTSRDGEQRKDVALKKCTLICSCAKELKVKLIMQVHRKKITIIRSVPRRKNRLHRDVLSHQHHPR